MKQLLFIPLLSTLLFLGCPDEKPPIIIPPTPTNCEYPEGNRNFTWRLDTVAWFPSTLGGIHAFSDSDAYLMGYIGEGKPPWRIFVGKHWDGTQWTTDINGTDAEVGHVANDVTGDDHFMVSVGNWSITPPKPAIGEFDNRTKKWSHYQFETRGELRSVWTDGNGFFIAVGDNGMVYTKDGYKGEWIYQKAPSGFNLVKTVGVLKSEIYILADSAVPGMHYQQIWKYLDNNWIKLMDNLDTTNTTINIPEAGDAIYDIAVHRCSISDSLYLYVAGRESFEFTAKGNSLEFLKINLSSKGLPFFTLQIPAGRIFLFSPNDYWISGLRYHIYHWNGVHFQKMEPIPSLSYGELWGATSKIRKQKTGKTWLILEMSSQTYAVIQGEP